MSARKNWFWYVTGVLLVALILRLPLLNGSFWMDEAAQAFESARPLSQQLSIAADFQPPLIHLLTFLTIRISHQEWWLRTWVALIPGLLSIIFTYKIGRKLHSAQAGLLASLLLATSSFHIFYSQELRPYALPLLWATLSWWLLIQWLDKAKRPQLMWFTIVTILGLYSSYLYPFLVFSQICWVLWQHRSMAPKFFLSLLISALAFAPWLPMFLSQLRVGGLVRTELPQWSVVVSTPQLKVLLLIVAKFIFGVLNVEVTPLFIVPLLIVIGALLSLGCMVITRKNKSLKAILLQTTWLVIPFITAWIVSFWVPVVQPKRLLYLLPAFYLLLTTIGLSQTNKTYRKWGAVLIGLVVFINVVSTARYYSDARLQRENWRGLHAQITTQFSPSNSIAVFAFDEPFASWRWYDDGVFPTWSADKLNLDDVPNLSEKFKVVTEYENVLLFEYLRDLTDQHDLLRKELWSLGYREIQAIDYPNIGLVRVYSRQKPVAMNEHYASWN